MKIRKGLASISNITKLDMTTAFFIEQIVPRPKRLPSDHLIYDAVGPMAFSCWCSKAIFSRALETFGISIRNSDGTWYRMLVSKVPWNIPLWRKLGR